MQATVNVPSTFCKVSERRRHAAPRRSQNRQSHFSRPAVNTELSQRRRDGRTRGQKSYTKINLGMHDPPHLLALDKILNGISQIFRPRQLTIKSAFFPDSRHWS